jgi:hypothetical protein
MSTISSGTTLTTALVQTGDTTGDLVIKTGSSNTTALTISGSNQSVTFAGAVNVASSAFANGSASAPSITFTGDTNTGIFSPGADSIGFAEGGAEIARFDSSGNLLLGTTTTGSTGITLSATYNLGWGQGAGQSVPNIFRQTSSAATVMANGYRFSVTSNGFASSFSSSYAKSAISCGTVAGGITFYTDTATTVAAGTDVTPTERMRIDSSGNVGIGTSSPATRLNVEGTLRINRSGQAAQYVNLYSTGGEGFIDTVNSDSATNQPLVFRIGNNSTTTERLRITSAGAISVGSSGTATGTAGQVLTSAGSGSSPTWSDVSVTTAAVLAATAGASLGAVGVYSWLWTTTTGAVTAGSTIAGSNLRYAGFQTGASGDNNNSDNSLSGNGGTPSGTWRVMGRGAQTNFSVFLALRIS